MDFKINGEHSNFLDFSKLFPEESNVLKEFIAEQWAFEVLGTKLMFNYGTYNPIYIDINAQLEYHKKYFYKNSIYKEPLAKAIGLKKGSEKPSILDATGGMLHDSILMFAMGIQSLEISERHPVVAALIINALKIKPLQNVNFNHLSGHQKEGVFDVVYYDPMYSEKNKKASPKKEMLIFREVIGEDKDAKGIAFELRKKANKRLVIKRSIKASPLLDKPSIQFSGKSTRYDVYLNS